MRIDESGSSPADYKKTTLTIVQEFPKKKHDKGETNIEMVQQGDINEKDKDVKKDENKDDKKVELTIS